jgi:NAD(P)H dehydrogenase (quinone)
VARCLAALAVGEPTGRHHDVTGPDSLPVDAVAAMAGYRYAETTPAEFAGMLLRRGEALWWTYAYTTMFESIRQGRWGTMSDAVAELTGHPPAPLPQVLRRGTQPQ